MKRLNNDSRKRIATMKRNASNKVITKVHGKVVMDDFGLLNKMNYVLPTKCAGYYMKVSGESVLEDGSKANTDKVKIDKCRKRTCEFCNADLVAERTAKIHAVISEQVGKGRSVAMITKTIPNMMISKNA